LESAEAERWIAALEAESQALRGKAERLRLLVDSARDHAIVSLNLEGQITGWNEPLWVCRSLVGLGYAAKAGSSSLAW
jgi:PAS domain-containing protein